MNFQQYGCIGKTGNSDWHASVAGGTFTESRPYIQSYMQSVAAERESVFSRDKLPGELSNPKSQA